MKLITKKKAVEILDINTSRFNLLLKTGLIDKHIDKRSSGRGGRCYLWDYYYIQSIIDKVKKEPNNSKSAWKETDKARTKSSVDERDRATQALFMMFLCNHKRTISR